MCAAVAISAQAQASKKKSKSPAKPTSKTLHIDQAYFAGHWVKFKAAPSSATGHALLVGPWNLGDKVWPKHNDMRPNCYFVFPGTQHRLQAHADFNNNVVLSAVPNEASNFDVYWVVVLDPTVQEDFTSEQQIIVATQTTFAAPEDLSFEQIPSAGFLRTFLKVINVYGLSRFKRPDGDLPRVAIIPAGFSVKALAEKPENTEASR
jgi:hypothetical protein